MLKPIMSVFSVDDDLLKDVVKFFFLFGKEKIRISADFLMKTIGDYMEDSEKSVLQSKTLLNQPFDMFYKYIINFLDESESIPRELSSHIEFKYSRKVVWDFIEFLIDLNDNPSIKRTVIANHLKNTPSYFDNEPFCRFVLESIKEVIENPKSLLVSSIENVFFLTSKLISMYNFIKVNAAAVDSLNRVVSSNEVSFDTEAVMEIQNVIEGMGATALGSSVDELVLDSDSLNLEIDNLNYPIVPVSIFRELKLFQEKRVYLIVGASGVGKSMILCHIASDMWLNTAYKKAPKEAIFYFTMENLKEEITARIVANAFYAKCGINKTIDDVVAGNFTTTEKNQLWARVKDVDRMIVIEYLPPKVYGAAMLRSLIKKKISEKGVVPYGVIVDYIDLMRCENKRVKDEHQELGEIVNELKALAGELSVPVVSVSHLNSDGCRLVKEDMKALGGRQMGKSLRKYENSDVVMFADEEATGGLPYSIMNFFVSKHRYARKSANMIYERKYLPEYSFLGYTKDDVDVDKKDSSFNMDKGSQDFDPFSDSTIGL